MTILLLCFLLGCVTGLRTLTGPAVVCWGAYFGWLHLAGGKLAFLGQPIALTIFTLLAVLELVADKLPKIPPRTSPQGMIPRILFGGLAAIALGFSAGGPVIVAAIAGSIGAIAGAFAGYHIRRGLVMQAHLPDFAVALAEDAIAIGAGFLIVSRL